MMPGGGSLCADLAWLPPVDGGTERVDRPSTGEVRPAPADSHRALRFAIVGDLQRRSPLEFWRERNDRETERIVQEVVRVRPELVVLLGDLVFRGSSAADCKLIDAQLAPWTEAGIEILPILGNHDYWMNPARALN